MGSEPRVHSIRPSGNRITCSVCYGVWRVEPVCTLADCGHPQQHPVPQCNHAYVSNFEKKSGVVFITNPWGLDYISRSASCFPSTCTTNTILEPFFSSAYTTTNTMVLDANNVFRVDGLVAVITGGATGKYLGSKALGCGETRSKWILSGPL